MLFASIQRQNKPSTSAKPVGVARHAYNWALARWKDYRAQGKWAKMKDLKAEYNKIKAEQFPWCYEVTKCAPEQELAIWGRHLTTIGE